MNDDNKYSSKIKSKEKYDQFYTEALNDIDSFWLKTTKDYNWFKEPTLGLKGSFNDEVKITWFEDGQLNITENILDRHIKDHPNKVALIFEPNDPQKDAIKFTYLQMYEKVCQIAEALDSQGVKKDDVVCFYMSMIPELLFSVLACARIGATHSVIFGGFSAEALKDRVNDCKPKCMITNDSGPRGSKNIPIKMTVDMALDMAEVKTKVLIWEHTGDEVFFHKERDVFFKDILNPETKHHPSVPVEAEHPLFILYTSGSTGKPKGLVHTTAGYMIWASETFKHVFQMQNPNDIFWCTADVGWITGHSYFTYGPFINGATQVMFEGIPTYPEPNRFWNIIDKHQVTHFYTAPTAIRALQACDQSYVKDSDLSSLKALGSVGEPINEEAWNWYKKNVGHHKTPIVDTWWQTETGGIMISNLAGVTDEKPTYATLPLPGVNPKILSPESKLIQTPDSQGHLCIKDPWPGMARTIHGDHKRFIDTYFSTHKGYYFTGDGAKFNSENFYRISGRVDDVVNVSGHRIGTAELEDVIDLCEGVIEAAVIGAPHPVKGQCLYAFVVSEAKSDKEKDDLFTNLNKKVTSSLGAFYKLEKAIFVSGLPKTRSGKIMRRLLRKISEGVTDLGDTSTLINPEVLTEIKNKI